MPNKAKLYMKLIFVYVFIMNTNLALIISFGSELIATFFTDQPVLISLINDTIAYMGIVVMIHGGSMIISGALRGLGK